MIESWRTSSERLTIFNRDIFKRILERHELQEVQGYSVRAVLEPAVAKAMPNDV